MLNEVKLIGNLGKDPEVRSTDGGKKVANLALATSYSYKNKEGEKIKKTEWHRVVLWDGLAEVAEKYLKKGNLVLIGGRLEKSSWIDKDGLTKYTTEIVCDNMVMLGGKPAEAPDSVPGSPEIEGDVLPY